MSPEILTIIGMTATVLIATWTMNRSLCSELRGDIKDVRNEIKDVRGEIKDVRGEIKDLRTELKEEIQDLRTELKEEIQDLRTELKEEIQDLREAQHGLNERMAGVEGLVMGLREAIVARAAA